MKFSFGFPLMAHPQNPEFLTAEAVAEFARAAEAAGFDSCSLTEHPLPSDPWLASGGHDALDPFVALAVAAGSTSRLRLLTNLTPAAVPQPGHLGQDGGNPRPAQRRKGHPRRRGWAISCRSSRRWGWTSTSAMPCSTRAWR